MDQAALLLIVTKAAFYLVSSSASNSCVVCIGLLKSILLCFFTLGMSPGDLGSHSARKGTSSYACAGLMVSLPMVAICLHAMWIIGHIKERYLQYNKASGQYLGRVFCGLEVNDVSFAVPPPFFDFKKGGERADSVYSLLKEYMGCGDHVPASVHCFFTFALHRCVIILTIWQKSCTPRTN
jgi:hypothetical protein